MAEPGARPLVGGYVDVTAGSGTAGGGSGKEKDAVVEGVSRKSLLSSSNAVVYGWLAFVFAVLYISL